MMRTSFAAAIAAFLLSIPAVALAQPGQPQPPPPPADPAQPPPPPPAQPAPPPPGQPGPYAPAPPPPGQPGPYQPAPPPPPMQGSYYYAAPPAGAQTHEGIFFRFGLGFGFTSMHSEDVDTTVSGPGAALVLSLGGNIAQNLIIYGELVGDTASDPKIEMGGSEFDTDDTTAGIFGFGVGLAYYLPSNVYFSGTIAATQLSVQVEGEDAAESDFGPGFSGMIGKEWWVSDNWGLGIAGQLLVASMKDSEGSDIKWNAVGGGLLFSATYD